MAFSEAPAGRPRGGEMLKVRGSARARAGKQIKNRRRQYGEDTPHGSLTEGHVKVMFVYGYSLSHGHHGFRPFTTDHREAAQPMGAAVAGVEVLC